MRRAIETVGIVGILVATIGLATYQQACTPAQTAADANFAACVLVTAATDEVAGMAPGAIVADVIAKCGGDAATIATILDAEAKAKALRASKVAK
jgi:hypothetical protein